MLGSILVGLVVGKALEKGYEAFKKNGGSELVQETWRQGKEKLAKLADEVSKSLKEHEDETSFHTDETSSVKVNDFSGQEHEQVPVRVKRVRTQRRKS